MKKRMLSLLIALCMALSLMPVTAFADDVEATHVTVKTAEELISAVEAATDGTVISVEGTIEVSQTLYVKSSVTFTGGGVIKAADDFAAKSNNVTDSNLMNLEVADKTLTLGDVTLDANGKAIALFCNKGKVVVDGAAITGGYSGTYVSGVYMTAGSQFEMNSGSITGNNSPYTNDGYMQYAADLWIGANATGAMTAINGGNIGNIFVNSNEWSAKNPGGFTLTDGNVTNLYVEYDAGFGGAFTYEGGTIENLYISTVKGNGDSVKVETLVPGTAYIGGVTNVVNPVAKINNKVYDTLNDAVAAATSDDTITLLDDVTVSSKIAIAEKSITIDFNGHTITGQQTRDDGTYGVRVFNVNNDAELLLTGKGVVTTPDANGEYFPDNDAVIVVDSNPKGNIKGNAKLIIDEDVKVIAPASYGVTIFGCNNENAKPTIVVRGEVTAEASALSGNGTYSVVDIIVEDTARLTSTESPCIYFPADGNLTINGGSITGVGGIEVKAGTTVVSISGDPYITATGTPSHEANGNGNSSVGYAIAAVENDGYGGNASVTIENGHYHGPIGVLIDNETERHSMISISGGYFTEDPSEYCVDGKTGVASDDANYPYTVGAKNDEAKPAEVEAVIVPADVAEGASEAAKNAAAAMDGAHVEQNNNLEAAVKNEANNNDITPNTSIKTDNGIKSVTEVLMELDGNSGIKEKDVVIVYQPYIDVKVADAKTDGTDTPKYTELTVEMTPMYRVIATTKDVYENEDATYYTDNTDKEHAQNAIIVEEAKELDLADKEYDVTVFLPDDFATDGDKLSVKHEKDNGSVEYYTGTYHHPSSSAYVQFTTKGFSPFTIYAASESAAEVDGVIYPSLQAAVDAVKNNGTIKLLKDVAADEKAMVSKTITFNVDPDNHTFNSANNFVAGNRTTVTSEELSNGVYSFKFTYTPSSGSGSTSSYYTVTVASTKNGTVSASTKSAAKDEVVTVTVKADNGYELDKLTITDANGNELKLTDKGDGKYTFVMPKSRVTVTATFALADENPIFDDIDKDAYYYDAIKWAVANGVTNGMSTTEFVPDGPCTRGQIVTFLWRAAGKPAPTTTNNPFVDVNEKDYYYEAVLWAVENGITNGMSETEFMPELTCTRAHGVTFLYRAMGKAVDAKAEFIDVPADAYYAQAVAWAAANGVTNGVSEELFAPDSACTRVQIVTFLYRANFIK